MTAAMLTGDHGPRRQAITATAGNTTAKLAAMMTIRFISCSPFFRGFANIYCRFRQNDADKKSGEGNAIPTLNWVLKKAFLVRQSANDYCALVKTKASWVLWVAPEQVHA
jgi:hypothetical protein